MRSVVSIFFICIGVFCFLTYYMGEKTGQAIKNTTSIYMSEMSLQVQEKFTAVINLRMQQVETMIQIHPPQEAVYGEEMINGLVENAQIRNFTYVGLYAADGKLEDLYGAAIELGQKSGIAKTIQPGAYAVG